MVEPPEPATVLDVAEPPPPAVVVVGPPGRPRPSLKPNHSSLVRSSSTENVVGSPTLPSGATVTLSPASSSTSWPSRPVTATVPSTTRKVHCCWAVQSTMNTVPRTAATAFEVSTSKRPPVSVSFSTWCQLRPTSSLVRTVRAPGVSTSSTTRNTVLASMRVSEPSK